MFHLSKYREHVFPIRFIKISNVFLHKSDNPTVFLLTASPGSFTLKTLEIPDANKTDSANKEVELRLFL